MGNGKKEAELLAVDLENGQLVALGQVDESNPWVVRRWLEPLVKRLEVSVIVSDNLASIRKVAEKLSWNSRSASFVSSVGPKAPPLQGGTHAA